MYCSNQREHVGRYLYSQTTNRN